ncbi:catalase-related domain-containing protein, partial [Senegalia sp. (in: firmicutes)]
QMRVDGNLGGEVHYEPNSYGNWKDHPEDNLPKEKGGDIYRYDFREDDSDYFTQPGMLFRAMTEDQQQVLFDNTARNMGDSTLQIKHRHIYHCYMADPEYGNGVAKAMNISIDDVDLDLPKRDSHKNQEKANNLHPELNVPTDPVDPGKEIDTNKESYIEPENDPWLL